MAVHRDVPGYELLDELGRGGFAVVYRARQVSVDRIVALKVIATGGLTEETERRFRSECRAVGLLSWHPHVVSLYDAGTVADHAYLAMELLERGSLGARVASSGPLPLEEAVLAVRQVLDALEVAHGEGIIHRDVKPDNLLVGRRGEVQLADFGIARLADSTRSATGAFTGTIAYAAPELLAGTRADAASDVYSVGATFQALLTGQHPFARTGADDSPAALMWRVIGDVPRPLPASVPGRLADLIGACLEKEPANRPATVGELVAALDVALAPPAGPEPEGGVVGGSTGDVSMVDDVTVAVTGPPEPPDDPDDGPGRGPGSGDHWEVVDDGASRPRRRARLAVGIAVVLLVVAGVSIAVLAARSDDPAPTAAAAESTTEARETTTTSSRRRRSTTTTTTAPAPPATPQAIATANPAGSYSGEGDVVECEGWDDETSANGCESLRWLGGWLEVACDPGGCVAQTPVLGDREVPLQYIDGAQVGQLTDVETGTTCGDAPTRSTVTLRFVVEEAEWDGRAARWEATAVSGSVRQHLVPQLDCREAAVTVRFTMR